MCVQRIVWATMLVLAGAAATPPAAAAQWYFSSFTGANFTRPADIVIDQPDARRHLTFTSVPFRGEPFKSPLYYGGRLGFLFRDSRFGLEGEFLHIKVIATTASEVRVTGQQGEGPIDVVQPMRLIVQDYEMSHGLNFWFVNVVWHAPLQRLAPRDRVALVVRGGAGPVVAGVNTRVLGEPVDHYEYAGLGMQGSAGLDVHVGRFFSITGEYKLTYTRPRIDVSGGTGQTTALTHHVAGGIALGFSR